jgi:hypothetical protein
MLTATEPQAISRESTYEVSFSIWSKKVCLDYGGGIVPPVNHIEVKNRSSYSGGG